MACTGTRFRRDRRSAYRLGFALVYPGLGIEAVRRAPPQSRGLAMGAYTAFLDVALGFGSPALGLIAGWAGLSSVFLAGALIVLCAAAIAARLLLVPRPLESSIGTVRREFCSSAKSQHDGV